MSLWSKKRFFCIWILFILYIYCLLILALSKNKIIFSKYLSCSLNLNHLFIFQCLNCPLVMSMCSVIPQSGNLTTLIFMLLSPHVAYVSIPGTGDLKRHIQRQHRWDKSSHTKQNGQNNKSNHLLMYSRCIQFQYNKKLEWRPPMHSNWYGGVTRAKNRSASCQWFDPQKNNSSAWRGGHP